MPRPPRQILTADEFSALADRLRERHIPQTPAQLAESFRLVRDGRAVSVGEGPAEPSLPAEAIVSPGEPSAYRLSQWEEHGAGWTATNDRLEIDIHGAPSMTHIDSTSHFTWAPRAKVSQRASLVNLANAGVVGRGVLVDVPSVLGLPLNDQVVTMDDVRQVLALTGTTVRPGDAIYMSFGRSTAARSDHALGSRPTPGLSIECAEWLANLSPSIVVTDEGLDSVPSEVEGQPVPWHLLLLTVLGIPLVDRAMLATLSSTCVELGRWEFLSVVSPLPIRGASGSPVNPLAFF